MRWTRASSRSTPAATAAPTHRVQAALRHDVVGNSVDRGGEHEPVYPELPPTAEGASCQVTGPRGLAQISTDIPGRSCSRPSAERGRLGALTGSWRRRESPCRLLPSTPGAWSCSTWLVPRQPDSSRSRRRPPGDDVEEASSPRRGRGSACAAGGPRGRPARRRLPRRSSNRGGKRRTTPSGRRRRAGIRSSRRASARRRCRARWRSRGGRR